MNILSTINIHPVIVHFPIALLMVYSIIEIISVFSRTRAAKLYTTKTIMLWIGVVGSFAALQTWEWAQHYMGITGSLVHTHEDFADRSHLVYSILAVYYILKTIVTESIWSKYWANYTQHYHSQLILFFSSRWTAIITTLLSMIWIGLLTVTGALGGAIAQGTGNWDPMVDWVVANFVRDTNTESSTSYLDQSNDMPYKDLDPSEYLDSNTQQITDIAIITPPSTGDDISQDDETLTWYTIQEVSTHNDENSCRSAINGVVYDLTAWISQHPWWDRNILRLCGTDGSVLFNGKHGGQALQAKTLAGFEIGVVTE